MPVYVLDMPFIRKRDEATRNNSTVGNVMSHIILFGSCSHRSKRLLDGANNHMDYHSPTNRYQSFYMFLFKSRLPVMNFEDVT